MDSSSENAMMQQMYTPTFGNGSFQIEPPSKGEVGEGFPKVPYLSIESIFYEQASSNPLKAPINTLSGTNTGQQIIGGQYTMQDNTQTNRYQMGYQTRQ